MVHFEFFSSLPLPLPPFPLSPHPSLPQVQTRVDRQPVRRVPAVPRVRARVLCGYPLAVRVPPQLGGHPLRQR